jgi:quercetin dioxygenase-like cupin family protein
MHDLINKGWFLAVALAAMIGAQAASAQNASDTKNDAMEQVRVAFAHVLPHLDAGQLQVKLVEVTYPPGGFSLPHTHPFPAIAYVTEGAVRIQIKGEPEAIYKAGEIFYEAPNGEHLVSANASHTQPAKLIACVICDNDKPVTLPINGNHAEGGK